MKLVAATANAHKIEEFQRILAPLGVEILSAAELGISLGDVEENGETFLENAAIKARAVYRAAGLPAFADDSGLCVDALDGKPGVYSARYGGEHLPHTQKIRLLLEELKDVPPEKRGAHFACAIVCVLDEKTELCCEEICRGTIGYEPRGTGGFGYDPIFMIQEKSFGELTDAEKDAVSHRGKALARFVRELAQLTESGKGQL